MQWTLWGSFGDLVISKSVPFDNPGEPPNWSHDRESLLFMLRGFIGDPISMLALRDAAALASDYPAHIGDHDVVEVVALAIVKGQLRLTESRPSRSPTLLGNTNQVRALAQAPAEPVKDEPAAAKQPAELEVTVKYAPDGLSITNATVEISGPSSARALTDASGKAVFKGLPPGTYRVTAKYQQSNQLVETVRQKIGSTEWALNVAKGPYPRNKWKCNLFVHDMLKDAGLPAPEKPHERKVLGYVVQTVIYPILAGDWASGSVSGWVKVARPEPGDIVAEAHDYTDASGHVGIVSYPKTTESSIGLTAAQKGTLNIELQRQVVSAAEKVIEENDWGFRPGQHPTFMHRQ